jgi:hypothetical protein
MTTLRPVIDALNGQGRPLKETAWDLKERVTPPPKVRPLRYEDVPLPSDDLFHQAEGLLQGKLTEWVEEWRKVRRPCRADPAKKAANYLSNHPEAKEILGVLAKKAPQHIMEIFLGMKTPPFQVAFSIPDEPILTAVCEAVRLFVILLRSNLSIGKCDLVRCQRYFINASGERSKRCCTRKHAGALATERRRARQHAASIARAAEAIEEWERKKPSRDWKSWVVRRTQLTSNFLTRGINRGELQAPKSVFSCIRSGKAAGA